MCIGSRNVRESELEVAATEVKVIGRVVRLFRYPVDCKLTINDKCIKVTLFAISAN